MSFFKHCRRAVAAGIGYGVFTRGGSGAPLAVANPIAQDSGARALDAPTSETPESAAHSAPISDAKGAIASGHSMRTAEQLKRPRSDHPAASQRLGRAAGGWGNRAAVKSCGASPDGQVSIIAQTSLNGVWSFMVVDALDGDIYFGGDNDRLLVQGRARPSLP